MNNVSNFVSICNMIGLSRSNTIIIVYIYIEYDIYDFL